MVYEVPSLSEQYEREDTFGDALYDWMGRAPFLAIAFAIHLLAFFLLTAIPWSTASEDDAVALETQVVLPPEDDFDEPDEPVFEDPVPDEVEQDDVVFDDPVIDDSEVESEDENDVDQPESPFSGDQWNDAIGTGGGAGTPGGGSKRHGTRATRPEDKHRVNVIAGLQWLADHQAQDGRWDCDDFMHDSVRPGPVCDGAGDPAHDVGVTGLAMLAFLGAGIDQKDQGPFGDVVRRGLAWMMREQDRETGLLGRAIGHDFLYDHSIGTLALTECLYSDPKNPLLRRSAERAVAYCTQARNPYGAWRYAVPANGESDTSVTGWMVFALASARDVGIDVPDADFRDAVAWFDEVTDPGTGRTGYTERGTASARPEHLQDAYPAERGEALTAVAMLGRIFAGDVLGDDSVDRDVLSKGANLLLEKLPNWSDDGADCDMYYWYYGSYAMFQMASQDKRAWSAWERAMESAIVPHQRKSPESFDGSWDPIGPWGHAGGRVYSTATMVLCLEVRYRYGRVLGAR
ncbi:MAG: hypothetical protein R3F34_03225 [Planctomycetota bacterium]